LSDCQHSGRFTLVRLSIGNTMDYRIDLPNTWPTSAQVGEMNAPILARIGPNSGTSTTYPWSPSSLSTDRTSRSCFEEPPRPALRPATSHRQRLPAFQMYTISNLLVEPINPSQGGSTFRLSVGRRPHLPNFDQVRERLVKMDHDPSDESVSILDGIAQSLTVGQVGC